MAGGLTKDEVKAAMKAALKEWLNEQFAAFGRWSFYGIMAMAFGVLVWLMLLKDGWHK